MQNRIKEHLPPKAYPLEELEADFAKAGKGCPHCNFPFSAPDEESGDLTCSGCFVILQEKWDSGTEHLFVFEALVAVKKSNTEEFREIESAEDVYPNEVASRIIVLRLPSSHVPGKHGLYPFNPANINRN